MMKRSQLKRGDVLIAIVGATIGNVGLYDIDNESNINQAIASVRIKKNLLPKFLVAFLMSKTGQQILNFLKRPVARANINLEEIGEILVPLPPLPIQEKLVEEMERARESRRRKLAEAERLLSTLDSWLLDTLGITPPPEDNRKVFAVRLTDVNKTSRLNSDYFHPERLLAVRNIEQQRDKITVAPLYSVVDFIRNSQKSPTGLYLGLANVQSHTGEFVETDEEVKGNVLEFKENDVLFGRLRPYLNKVYRAEFDGVCSPEFHVMRTKNDNELNPIYLSVILRSSIILAQTKHMMTGNTHPRLTNEDVVNLVIPIPSFEVQEIVAEEVKSRKSEARRLQDEAETEWQGAKDWFEAQLLTGEDK